MEEHTSLVMAYLYLHTAEQMPEDADDEWFLRPEPNPVNREEVKRFLQETEKLLDQLRRPLFLREDEIQTLFYDAAKATFDGDKTKIRTYFKWLYLILFQRDYGPRWGQFVQAYGKVNFIHLVQDRIENLI